MENNGAGKRRKAKMAVLGLFLFAGIAGGGWWLYQTTKYVSTDDARIAGNIYNVSAKIPGRVAEVLVSEGDTVEAGQVLARLETKEIMAQKAQAEAALAAARARWDEVTAGYRPEEIRQAQAKLDQARANLVNLTRNYERAEKLFKDGAISATQRDAAETAYLVGRDAVTAAEQQYNLVVTGNREEVIRAAAAQVKQAEANLQAANIAYENSIITSPVSGTIALKSVNPGEVVAAGQPLFSVTDLKDVWVNVRVEETKIGRIKIGQRVDYTIDGYPGETFTGKVYEIGSAANSVFALIPNENASNNYTKVTQRIPIKVSLPQGTPFVFRPGMSAVVKIYTQD